MGFLAVQRDHPQQQVAEASTVPGVELVVHRLGGPGQRALDAAGRPVAGERQRPGLAKDPGLMEGVGQQRERARVPARFLHQHLDEPRLDATALPPGGFLDRVPQPVLGHGPEHIGRALEGTGQVGQQRQRTHVIGSEDDHQATERQLLQEDRGDRLAHRLVIHEGEELLGLIQGQDGLVRLAGQRPLERGQRLLPEPHDDDRTTLGPEARNEAGSHEGRLAVPRPGDEQEGTRLGQAIATCRQLGVTAVEQPLVGLFVSGQPFVWAG